MSMSQTSWSSSPKTLASPSTPGLLTPVPGTRPLLLPPLCTSEPLIHSGHSFSLWPLRAGSKMGGGVEGGSRKEGWGGGGGATRWGWGHLPGIFCPALAVPPGGPQAEHSPGQSTRLTQGRRLRGFAGQVREMRRGVGTKEDVLLCSSNFLRKALASRSCGAPGMGSWVPGRAPWWWGSVGAGIQLMGFHGAGLPGRASGWLGSRGAGLYRSRGQDLPGWSVEVPGRAHAALLCGPGRTASQVVRVSLTHPRAFPGPLRGPGRFHSMTMAQPAPWPPAARGSPEKLENGCHPATGPGGPGGMGCIPGGSQVSTAQDGGRGVKRGRREWGRGGGARSHGLESRLPGLGLCAQNPDLRVEAHLRLASLNSASSQQSANLLQRAGWLCPAPC